MYLCRQMRHHDGDMELDLGLSIGGSLRRLPETTTSGSSLTLISDGDEESGVTDAKARGEIQAVRRREAKRKREEKRHRRAQQQQPQNPPFKKGKQEAAALGSHSQCNVDHPPLQMPYTYYVPFLNGYAFPCVVPYWSAAAAGADHHPVPCRSFGPFQTNQNVADAALSNGCQSGSKSTKSASGSSGSPVCSSSVISDHYHSSSSHEGTSSILRDLLPLNSFWKIRNKKPVCFDFLILGFIPFWSSSLSLIQVFYRATIHSPVNCNTWFIFFRIEILSFCSYLQEVTAAAIPGAIQVIPHQTDTKWLSRTRMILRTIALPQILLNQILVLTTEHNVQKNLFSPMSPKAA